MWFGSARHTGLLGFSLITLILGGCQPGAQPTSVYGSNQLPKDWLTLAQNDWRLAALPAPTSDYLASVRSAMIRERNTEYYHFYGRYTDGTLKQIAEANNIASTAFLVAPRTVYHSLTPELFNTSESYDEANGHFAVQVNTDLRSLQNDWSRVWLTDRPSSLSPYPITPMGGQP